MRTLKDWQARRTPALCGRAAAEVRARFPAFFGALSPFASPLPPDAADILEHARIDTDLHVYAVKNHYRRDRPFLREPSLTICPGMGKVGGFAYPSGHAAIARTFALMLSDLVPPRRAEFLARADEIALDRVIAGVHHPSDIESGKLLGDAIYARLQAVPKFRADMDRLRRLLAH
jgi:acid phosphatase (class A)